MAIELMQRVDVIEAMENFLFRRRPPEELRDKVDVNYRIDNQSVIIYEIRPRWNNPKEYRESEFAKATFVKTRQHWNIYWLRSDLKWHTYEPKPFVKTINDFAELVDEDRYHCFWG